VLLVEFVLYCGCEAATLKAGMMERSGGAWNGEKSPQILKDGIVEWRIGGK